MTPSTGNAALFDAAQFNAALFGGQAPTGIVTQAGAGLLYPALRKAGVVIGPQRTPSPAQFQDSVDECNRLLGSLNCDPLFIYGQDILTFPLQAGKKIYTIGIDPTGNSPASDFPVTAPQFITYADYVYAPNNPPIRYPLALFTPQVWSRIRVQDVPNTIPQGIYYDRGFPIAQIYFYGQPQGGQLELYCWHTIPRIQNTTDAVLLPLGYEDAIVLNLACRLAPHFQRVLDPNVFQQARESLMRLESKNAPQPILDTGCGCTSGYMNAYTGEIR